MDVFPNVYKFCDWVDLGYIDYSSLCMNIHPMAMNIINNILSKNPNSYKVDFNNLSMNESDDAVDILEKYPDNIGLICLAINKNPRVLKILETKKDDPEIIQDVFFSTLSSNPSAIELLKRNISSINYTFFSENESAVDLLLENPSKIDWARFCLNSSDKALDYLEANPMKINWNYLCGNTNPRALFLISKYLENNPENIEHFNWRILCENSTKEAIDLVKKYYELIKDKLDWWNLTINPYAIDLIKENIDLINKIYKSALFSNPCIFEYDYEFIRNRMNIFKEELVEKVFHPKNYNKFIDWGYCDYCGE